FGGGIGLLVLLIFMKKYHASHLLTGTMGDNRGKIVQQLFVQGIAICVCHLVLVLIQFIDSFSFYSLLVDNGYGEVTAKVATGVYDRALPLIQLGTVAETSLSLALLPSMTEANARGDKDTVVTYIHIVSKYCSMLSLGATIGLMVLARPINTMFFENDAGTSTLRMLSLTIFLTAIIITTASILQSLGEVILPAVHVLLGMVGKWIGNLVFIPIFHVNGAALATIVALVIVVICNCVTLYRKKGYVFMTNSGGVRMVFAGIVMALVLMFYQS